MARSVDLFISSDLSEEALAGEIGRLTGLAPVAGQGSGGPVIAEGGVETRLHRHAYIDDGDLFLSRYRWCLSAAVTGESRLADSREVALLRSIGDRLQRCGGIACLLVLDLQYREALPRQEPEVAAAPEAELG